MSGVKIERLAKLYCYENSSNKFINMRIEENSSGYLLNYETGAVGGTPVYRTRTPDAVSKEVVLKEWDKLFNQKVRPKKYKVSHLENNPIFDPEFWHKAVSRNGLLLQLYTGNSSDVQFLAVKQNWKSILFANNITEEMCLNAYKQDMRSIALIWNHFPMRSEAKLFQKSFNVEVPDSVYLEIVAFDTQRKLEVEILKLLNNNAPKNLSPARKRIVEVL